MHCLETIAIRNAQAAGRAASHAYDDQDTAQGDAIAREHEREYTRIEAKAGSDFALKVDAAFLDAYGKAQDAEPWRCVHSPYECSDCHATAKTEPRPAAYDRPGYAEILGAWLDARRACCRYHEAAGAASYDGKPCGRVIDGRA